MQQIVIVGVGGLARLAHDVILAGRELEVVAFADPDGRGSQRAINGVPVLSGLGALVDVRVRGVRHALVAVSSNPMRVELAAAVEAAGYRLCGAVHPTASIAGSARIGPHVLIGAKAILCPHCEIGAHSVLSTGAIVEHDNRIGVGVFLAPAVRLAGGVVVEDLASVGIGSSVIPYKRIGRSADVRPGSVVLTDIPSSEVVSGVPARGVAPACAAALLAHS